MMKLALKASQIYSMAVCGEPCAITRETKAYRFYCVDLDNYGSDKPWIIRVPKSSDEIIGSPMADIIKLH